TSVPSLVSFPPIGGDAEGVVKGRNGSVERWSTRKECSDSDGFGSRPPGSRPTQTISQISKALVTGLGTAARVRRAELFVQYLDNVGMSTDGSPSTVEIAIAALNLGLTGHDREVLFELGHRFLGLRQGAVVEVEVVLGLSGLDQLQLGFDIGKPGDKILF